MFHCVYIHSVYVYTTLSLSYPFSKYSPNKQIFSHIGPACFAYPMKFHPSANHRKDKINHLAINKTPSSCWPSELCDPDNPCWAAEQQQINPRSPPRGLASKLTHAVRDLPHVQTCQRVTERTLDDLMVTSFFLIKSNILKLTTELPILRPCLRSLNQKLMSGAQKSVFNDPFKIAFHVGLLLLPEVLQAGPSQWGPHSSGFSSLWPGK